MFNATFKWVALAVMLSGAPATLASDDDTHTEPAKPARSGVDLAKACAACHGADGNSISPDFPNIAGQYRSYLLYTLKGYRSGERDNAIMKSFVNGLSDEELGNLATYYSEQDGLKTLPNED